METGCEPCWDKGHRASWWHCARLGWARSESQGYSPELGTWTPQDSEDGVPALAVPVPGAGRSHSQAHGRRAEAGTHSSFPSLKLGSQLSSRILPFLLGLGDAFRTGQGGT